MGRRDRCLDGKQGIDLPFIVLTGFGDESIAVEMMKLGADDYIVKSNDMVQLLPGTIQRLTQEIEAIGTFAGGIAHDFNNILSAIMSYLGNSSQHRTPDNGL